MDEQTLSFIMIAVMALLLLLTISSMIRVIPEYQRLVVLSLGRYRGTRGPGLVFLMPFLEQALKVDLRQKTLNIPPVALVTADKEGLSQAMTIVFRIVEPMLAVLRVENAEKALTTVATTALRAVIADTSLDDLKFKPERVRLKLQSNLEEAAERWGVRIESVELRAGEVVEPVRAKNLTTWG